MTSRDELIKKTQDLLRMQGINSTQWKILAELVAGLVHDCIHDREIEIADELERGCALPLNESPLRFFIDSLRKPEVEG